MYMFICYSYIYILLYNDWASKNRRHTSLKQYSCCGACFIMFWTATALQLLAVTSTLESGSFPRFGNQVASDSDCLLVFASRDWTIPIEDLPICCLVLRKQPPRLIDITRDTGSEKGLAMVWIGATLVSIKFPSLLQRSQRYIQVSCTPVYGCLQVVV